MTTEERKLLAQQPITWGGDLSDDCTALWAGLMLRAEWMDEDYWWWRVYDMQKEEAIVDCSNNYNHRFIGGDVSRQKAESVAQLYIDDITTREEVGSFLISDTFKITGRGIILGGYITEGVINIGDTIEFIGLFTVFQRTIIGIEGIRKSQPDKVNTGLLIKCTNDTEINELQNWKPVNVVAIIYKTENPHNRPST